MIRRHETTRHSRISSNGGNTGGNAGGGGNDGFPNGRVAEAAAIISALKLDRLVCGICQADFPVYLSGRACLPWLFADPAATLLEWKARFNGFLHANWDDQSRL